MPATHKEQKPIKQKKDPTAKTAVEKNGQERPAEGPLALRGANGPAGPHGGLAGTRTERQVQRRRVAVASAIGSTEAEGLHVSADTTADLNAYARGELNAEALRYRALARYTR